ncbi:helix-turn-helix transcriptional regulator [Vallitalea pronyensis]|uniref:Helix-turn-helix transcriptional regulator n=1 Tax=Vallitalea pronyensis TaxID=1348613 RepID=A0A8J8MQ48_9FIRM|nr:helix-turn-helix transcriptional regulator [Vallitalea pronyensis]QUI25537.1 helix-turn-helix transcriptional regulator [Vallitalea pronyensis]
MDVTIYTHMEFLYYLFAILTSFNTLIILILSYKKTTNKYVQYFLVSYLATFVMVVCHTAQLFAIRYLGESYRVITYVELIAIGFITLGIMLLVIRLIYEKTSIYYSLLMYVIAAMPMVFLLISAFMPTHMFWMGYRFFYWQLYILLAIHCILFVSKKDSLNDTQKNAGLRISILISVFVVIFIILRFSRNNFNPLPLFYISLNILLIKYGWQYFFSSTLDKMLYSNNGFVEKYKITQREKEIIDLILSGKTNKDIAATLFIAEKTVKNHVYNIYKKLDINSRFELICLLKN